jgi:general secretion pathway protein A
VVYESPMSTEVGLSATMRLIERYGMTEPPFSLSPDPRYLYMTPQHTRALAHLRFTIDDRAGLAVLYGDVGHGKSTIVRRLFDLYRDAPDYNAILLTNPDQSTALQLLKRVTDLCGLDRRATKLDQMRELEDHLVEQFKDGKNVVMLVDEAQLLHGPQFELIRQLTNFESSRSKLVQIILVGQNNLRNKLRLKKALLSRAAAVSTLDPLTPDETREMIEFRLRVAGRTVPLFEPKTITEIHRLTKGVPRDIVKRCRVALIVAAMNQLDTIPPEALEDGASEA